MSKCFGIVKVTYEHKWRNGRWKKFKKVGKLMIKVKRQSNDHRVVTFGQKRFSMVISYSSTFEYFFLPFFTYA